mmetsp:Transcript_16732/g.28985  ORF Transcript_16732/g.28985 Transcript_16732/m.28985 type:complete len:127 (+) Transcript_16732:47-427(+)|eukprot:CAMPEP_0196656408 /NCGR_PEP_ID=MMETSP1086-20130531/16801_1 /TAXON_ID=77921 /ORGANISM="Cyanoptyche  gloeocystis , Strain SAG4.97" /LENGTH=126 /DNA_ID=CAMNT_0041989145 /DNA_START=41 /DNA_END=421 /DNA_ORIENTATION=+
MGFSVAVREHIMIAHSFKGEVFGPAQKTHGATYVVDAEFFSDKLDKDNIIVDISLAMTSLKEVLAPYNYQNLDEIEEFKGINTTTEYLSYVIFEKMKARFVGKFQGQLKISLHESHVAWASYQGSV